MRRDTVYDGLSGNIWPHTPACVQGHGGTVSGQPPYVARKCAWEGQATRNSPKEREEKVKSCKKKKRGNDKVSFFLIKILGLALRGLVLLGFQTNETRVSGVLQSPSERLLPVRTLSSPGPGPGRLLGQLKRQHQRPPGSSVVANERRQSPWDRGTLGRAHQSRASQQRSAHPGQRAPLWSPRLSEAARCGPGRWAELG